MPLHPLRSLVLALVLALAGCAVPPDPQSVAYLHGSVRAAADKDRSGAARAAAGLAAAHAGVSIGCAMVNDAAEWRFLDTLRAFCFQD